MTQNAAKHATSLRRAACGSKVSAIQEFNMSLSLASLFHVNTGAARAALLHGQVIGAVGYYFFGYWFSHKRA
jgi:hypothetical protein